MTTWYLILFLTRGYSGGALAVPMPNETACHQAVEIAKDNRSYEDAFCIQGSK